MNDEAFKRNVLVALARIEEKLAAHQKNSCAHEQRLAGLEHIVNGNGSVGLAEEVRSLKGRWALMVTGGTLAVSALFNLLPELARFIARKTGG